MINRLAEAYDTATFAGEVVAELSVDPSLSHGTKFKTRLNIKLGIGDQYRDACEEILGVCDGVEFGDLERLFEIPGCGQ